ncbi:hypothetical protein B0H16DRAFT_1461479 [Mycena metata]|uniref:Uncharacterized protein n=1 Tax=Mycena metata TaxID=1033252 RepID=A0AAD7IRH3_9AGAR|nr:hypothetical protein B0H16DRAFT_1461479 [Mycena metata]
MEVGGRKGGGREKMVGKWKYALDNPILQGVIVHICGRFEVEGGYRVGIELGLREFPTVARGWGCGGDEKQRSSQGLGWRRGSAVLFGIKGAWWSRRGGGRREKSSFQLRVSDLIPSRYQEYFSDHTLQTAPRLTLDSAFEFCPDHTPTAFQTLRGLIVAGAPAAAPAAPLTHAISFPTPGTKTVTPVNSDATAATAQADADSLRGNSEAVFGAKLRNLK